MATRRKRRPNFTQAEKAEITRRFIAGASLEAMAADFNTSASAVYTIAREQGAPRRHRKRSVIVRGWTEEQDSLLIAMTELQKATWSSISARVGHPPNICASRYNQLSGGKLNQPIKSLAEIDSEKHKRLGERAEERDRRALALLEREEAEAARGILTSSFFGDPPPGYSALDKRKPRLVSP